MAEIGFGFPLGSNERETWISSASGTYSVYIPYYSNELLFTGIGGGGGGGGDSAVDGAFYGGGGGGGAYATNCLISVIPKTVLTITVGIAGAESTGGGATILSYLHPVFGFTTLTLNGGGAGGIGNNVVGTAGVPTHAGTLSPSVSLGLSALYTGNTGGVSQGAGSIFGVGGAGGLDANGSSPAGNAYGCGGGGAGITIAVSRNGAAGIRGYAKLEFLT